MYLFLLRFSLYDEDGYAAIKRVIERGEDIATVKPIATVVINYPVISHNKLFGKSLKYKIFYRRYVIFYNNICMYILGSI